MRIVYAFYAQKSIHLSELTFKILRENPGQLLNLNSLISRPLGFLLPSRKVSGSCKYSLRLIPIPLLCFPLMLDVDDLVPKPGELCSSDIHNVIIDHQEHMSSLLIHWANPAVKFRIEPFILKLLEQLSRRNCTHTIEVTLLVCAFSLPFSPIANSSRHRANNIQLN